jgi:small-conductance mechanosensitive channel
MKVYLWQRDGKVFHYAAQTEKEAKANAKQLDGFTTAPNSSATIEEWEAAGNTAYIDSNGAINLGLPPDVKEKQDQIAALTIEKAQLENELSAKDYKVVQTSEKGENLKETDPELHERREYCRGRIREIRERLAELETAA